MNPARKNSEVIGVLERKADKLMIWEDFMVKEHEEPMFGGLHRYDVTSEARECRPQRGPRPAERPPIVAESAVPTRVTLWLRAIKQPLVSCGKPLLHFLLSQPEEIDYQHLP